MKTSMDYPAVFRSWYTFQQITLRNAQSVIVITSNRSQIKARNSRVSRLVTKGEHLIVLDLLGVLIIDQFYLGQKNDPLWLKNVSCSWKGNSYFVWQLNLYTLPF